MAVIHDPSGEIEDRDARADLGGIPGPMGVEDGSNTDMADQNRPAHGRADGLRDGLS